MAVVQVICLTSLIAIDMGNAINNMMPPGWMQQHEWEHGFFMATTGRPYPPRYMESVEQHPNLHMWMIVLAIVVAIAGWHRERMQAAMDQAAMDQAAMDHED